jgi:phage minor structural protein
MIFVLDNYENVVTTLNNDVPDACPYYDDLLTERLDDAYLAYEFYIPADHPDAKYVKEDGYLIRKGLDDDLLLFQITRVEEIRDEEGLKKYVYAEYAWEELNKTIIRPGSFLGRTAEQAMNDALIDTRWKVGRVEWFGTADFVFDEHITTLAFLHEIKDTFGAELRFRVEMHNGRVSGRYVDLLVQRGQNIGKTFTYEKDLIGARRIHDRSTVCTALIGVGKGDENGNSINFANVVWSKANGDPVDKPAGQDWVGDPEALERWGHDGKHLFGVFEYETNQPEVLLQKTWEHLQKIKNGILSYEVNVALLESVPGYEHEKVRIGDTVLVQDLTFEPPLMVNARVLEMQRSFTDPSKDSVVLGQFLPAISNADATIKKLQSLLLKKEVLWATDTDNIYKGTTPPGTPVLNQLWLDTSVTPNRMMRWDGSAWVRATPINASDVGAEKETHKGPTPPSDTSKLWIDTSQTPNVLKRWDGSQWVKITPTNASEIVYADLTTLEQLKPAQPGADVTSQNTAKDTAAVGGLPAATVSTAVTNFNNRNDRKSTPPANPTIATDGTAVDHTINNDGSADISFEWQFNGSGDAYDIDGFIIYVYQSTSGSAYTFGTSPASEQVYVVTSDKRAFILYGVPADRYYTFGVQAYRIVDPDINASGILKSAIVKPTAAGENPYRPTANIAFAGNITGTVNGVPASTLTTQASRGDQAKTKIDNDVGAGTIETTSGAQQKANQAEQNAKNAVANGQVDLPAYKLIGAINTATNRIQASSEFYWEGGTLIAIDPNNTNNVVKISSGGIGVSTDGGQTFKNAITGEGVVAEAITAGTITGVTIIGGIITSNSVINVTTDLYVGDNIYLGDQNAGTPKGIYFNDAANIIGGTGFVGADIDINANAINNFAGEEVLWYGLRFENGGYYPSVKVEFMENVEVEINQVFRLKSGAGMSINDMVNPGSSLYISKNTGGQWIQNYAETGWCGVGARDGVGTTAALVGVGVQYRTKKGYVPASITTTTVSGNATPNIIDINDTGFWLYVNGNGTAGIYLYWRGYYSG